MFDTFKNAWKVQELRKRLLYTLMILVIFRLGCVVTVPFIDPKAVGIGGTDMLSFLNMMSGGALSNGALFALSVQPYINASIIIQLLAVAIPALERLAKEGREGQRKMQRITRYTGAGIAVVMGIGFYTLLRNGYGAVTYTSGWEGWFAAVTIVACFVAGSMVVTWMGEQIDEKGIGNGISLMIFIGIVSRWSDLINAVGGLITRAQQQPLYYIFLPLLVVFAIAVIVFVVILNAAERRIPVKYAQRVVGRKMYGGQSTYIPIKVNMSGVMPVIFASSLCMIPGTIAGFINLDAAEHPYWTAFFNMFNSTSLLYAVVYALLIIGFNYFYVAIQYNPVDIAKNLRENNGAIPGIRGDRPTAEFITRVLGKLTFIGALFLVVVAILPIILANVTGVAIHLGGTSMLIVVGVALDTTRSLESYMAPRHYKSILK